MKNRAVKKAKRRNVGFEVSASCSSDVLLTWFPSLRACMQPMMHSFKTCIYRWGCGWLCACVPTVHTWRSEQPMSQFSPASGSWESSFRSSGLVTRQVLLPSHYGSEVGLLRLCALCNSRQRNNCIANMFLGDSMSYPGCIQSALTCISSHPHPP